MCDLGQDRVQGRVKAGRVDLAKVVRFALQHAASAGSLMIPPRRWWRNDGNSGRLTVDRPAAAWMTGASEMVEQDGPDPAFDAMTSRLLRREAMRRAAEELNTTSGPGLEDVLKRISAEVTAEASLRTAVRKGIEIAGVTARSTFNEWNQLHHN